MSPAPPDGLKQSYNDFDATDQQAPHDDTQATPEAVTDDALIAALEGTGMISGFSFLANGTMTITTDGGVGSVRGQRLTSGPRALSFDDFDGTAGPCRLDSVRMDSSGVLYVSKGIEGPIPVMKPLARDANGHVSELLLLTTLIDADTDDGLAQANLQHQGCPPASGQTLLDSPIATFQPVLTDSNPPMRLAVGGAALAMDLMFYDPTPGFEAYYVVWANNTRQPMLGVISVRERLWHVTKLVSLLGQISPNRPDLHFYVALGMDERGFLHVTGNTHTGPLKYCRSDFSMWGGGGAPAIRWIGDEDNPAFTSHANMSGQNEDHITFPVLFQTSDGTLFYSATQSGSVGDSGNANFTLKRYNAPASGNGQGTWTEFGAAARTRDHFRCITDGESWNVNMFPGSMMLDSNDDLHVIFNWRDNEGPGPFGQGWWYFKLTGLLDLSGTGNNVKAWRKPDGTDQVTLPMSHYQDTNYAATHDPQRVASFTAPNLLNNPGVAVTPADSRGFPHTTFAFIVGDATAPNTLGTGGSLQHFHLWYDPTLPVSSSSHALASGWHVQQLSRYVTNGAGFLGGSGTPAGSASRPIVACFPDGKVYALFCWPVEGFAEATWAYDLTGTGEADTLDPPFKLHEYPDQGDFHFDYNSIKDGKIRMLLTSAQRYWKDPAIDDWGSALIPAAAGLVDPSPSWLGIMHVDFSRVGVLKSRTTRLPRIIRVGSAQATNLRQVNQHAPTGASLILQGAGNLDGSITGFLIGPEYAGKVLLARATALMQVDSGTGFVCACIQSDNYQEINAQVLQVGEAENASPIIQTPVTQTDPMSAFQTAYCGTIYVKDDQPAHNVVASAWVVLPNFRDPNGGMGRVSIAAFATGNAQGTIFNATVEVGYLDL